MKNFCSASEGWRLLRCLGQIRTWTVLVGFWVALPARAADATDARETLAETLFAEGRTHLLAQKYDKACPLFAESLRLDPASGTALNLALCQERQGKLASAWASYKTVLSLAQNEHKPAREKLAEQRMGELRGRRSALVVSVSPTVRRPGLSLELDGVLLPESAWGAPYPVDGGSHALRATAAERADWQSDVTLADEGDTKVVEVPLLRALVALVPVTPAPATSSSASEDKPPRRRGWTSVALGSTAASVTVTALAVGAYYGLQAKSHWDERTRLCPEAQTVCSDAAVNAGRSAERAAGISTAAFSVGIASAAVTTYIAWRFWPDWFPPGRAARPSISATAGGASLLVAGSF